MYKVIKDFFDLTDRKDTKAGPIYHHYSVGDIYPREGLKPSQDRVSELASPDNLQSEPLIAESAVADATVKLEAAAKEAKQAAKKRRTRAKSTAEAK